MTCELIVADGGTVWTVGIMNQWVLQFPQNQYPTTYGFAHPRSNFFPTHVLTNI
jgi:hypothetical protein